MPEHGRKREIERLDALLARKGSFPILRVPRRLAEAFENHEAPHRRRTTLIGLWLSLVCFPGFFLVDCLLMPDVVTEALVIRFGIAVPLVAASLWLVATHRLAGAAINWLVVALGFIAAALTSTMIVSSSSPHAMMSFSYNNIILVFMAVVFQPSIATCAVTSVLVIGVTGLFARFSPNFELGFWVFYVSSAVVTYVPCLYVNWSFADQRWRQFLHARRDALRLEELEEQNRMLEQLSVIEPLTGLANRRGFERALEAAVQRAAEQGGAVAIAMIDIDFFKAFNDRYGHPAGDECLRRVATALGGSDEGRHFTARLGGEEFAVILTQVDRRLLGLLGERLRSAVAALDLPHAALGEGRRVTISLGIGYALLGPGLAAASPGTLVDAADGALYEAKRTGRDRVVVAEPVETFALSA